MDEQRTASAATLAAAPASATARRSAAVEVGSRDGLFGLLIRNMLLGALTLMLYRFWARTALRRYLWGRVRIDGDPLEYTGRGSELFVGFLVAMAVLVPILGGFAVVEQFLEPASPTFFVEKLVYVLLILVLIAVAQFRARRYRLSRTLWRGIRFAQTGSQVAFLRLTLGWTLLALATLGLAYPWLRWAQTRYLMNNTWIGDRPVVFAGSARAVLLPWLLVVLAAMVPIAAMVAGILETLALVDLEDLASRIGPIRAVATALTVGAMASVPVLFLAYLNFRVREIRAIAAATRLGDASFRSQARTRNIVGQLLLYALALLLLVAVVASILGGMAVMEAVDVSGRGRGPNAGAIGAIVAALIAFYALAGTLWTWIVGYGVLRHVGATLTIDNVDSLATIGQSTLAGPRSGEGLADSFDVGV
ncbi:MAG: DUF898 family protein [Alphaproteobacteria bacterium]|nr:DUF898 family protein [Alphaproteobacteria bacterium]